jgi:hypothetical protein
MVTEEMFGGQHRIDEAKTARASWGDTGNKIATETRLACPRKGVFVDRKNKKQNLLKRSASLEITRWSQWVDATPSDIRLLSKVVWDETRSTVWTFCEREERDLEAMEDRRVAA